VWTGAPDVPLEGILWDRLSWTLNRNSRITALAEIDMVQYFTDNTAHVATPTHIMSMGALPHIIIILGILSPPCAAVLLAPATATATSADFVVKVKVLDNAPSGAPVRTATAAFARSTSPLLSAST
jgi:hypothetical protein